MKAEIKVILGDITTVSVDAIVNAANNTLLGGGGVDGAIHNAAGPGLLKECKKMNGCKTGYAKITNGYNLRSNYIIHTVGPIWKGGKNNESKELENSYYNSLKLAEKNNCKSIAFPSISTGVFGFPLFQASKIAFNVIYKYLQNTNNRIEKVILVCYDNKTKQIYDSLHAEIHSNLGPEKKKFSNRTGNNSTSADLIIKIHNYIFHRKIN